MSSTVGAGLVVLPKVTQSFKTGFNAARLILGAGFRPVALPDGCIAGNIKITVLRIRRIKGHQYGFVRPNHTACVRYDIDTRPRD
jgi:hypothetical protein